MATFTSKSAVETEELGRQLGQTLTSGRVIALTGELGTGKTQFVKGMALGLGASTAVTSPTFTLIHEYTGGRLPLYHFDFFRLENEEEAARLGLDDYFFSEAISVVEWADRFPSVIPAEAQWVSFVAKSDSERAITISGDQTSLVEPLRARSKR